MNISETILRVGATIVHLAPRAHDYYLNHVVTKREGQDVLTLIGPLILVMLICFPFYLYEIIELYKGVRRNAFSRLQICEIMLLLFSWNNYYFLLAFFLPKTVSILLVYIIEFGFPALILHYVIWIYRKYFTVRRTRSAQSIHE